MGTVNRSNRTSLQRSLGAIKHVNMHVCTVPPNQLCKTNRPNKSLICKVEPPNHLSVTKKRMPPYSSCFSSRSPTTRTSPAAAGGRGGFPKALPSHRFATGRFAAVNHSSPTEPQQSPSPSSSSSSPSPAQQAQYSIGRRSALFAPMGIAAATTPLMGWSFASFFSQPVSPAYAFTPPPPGYRLQNDKLDGYSFVYPEFWSAVTSSGNDVFYRNPVSPHKGHVN